jgi:hypothetical protein
VRGEGQQRLLLARLAAVQCGVQRATAQKDERGGGVDGQRRRAGEKGVKQPRQAGARAQRVREPGEQPGKRVEGLARGGGAGAARERRVEQLQQPAPGSGAMSVTTIKTGRPAS